MKIGIYNELTVHTLGGAECAVAALAEWLKRWHDVEVINHCTLMTVEELAEFSGTDLAGVRMRYVPFSDQPYQSTWNLWRRYRRERAWQAELSAPYDVFVHFAHWIPPFCHARAGVLIVMFPLFISPDTWVGEPARTPILSPLRKQLRRWYYGWQWPRRLASYRLKLAISNFTRVWTRRWWDVACPVVYPPVGTDFAAVPKQKTILSVGRYTPGMDSKKQFELTAAYSELAAAQRNGWQLVCAGRLSNEPQDHAYYETVRQLGATCGARILATVPRAEVRRLVEEAAIFWHATGLGADPEKQPHAVEHFGIAVGEAMAAGCVPVVINMGGPAEIVQHGVSGFLWNDLREMTDYTRLLIEDETLRSKMAAAARHGARNFSRERFRQRLAGLLQPLVPGLIPAEAS